MDNEKKFCPIMICSHATSGRCIGQDCAWWFDIAKDCSVPLLAGMFAESEIYRNVFDSYVNGERMEDDGK